MTYTTASPLLGKGTTSAAAVQAWFEKRGRQLAPQFGKNGQYTPVPAELGRIIVEESQRWAPYIINHDIAAGQIDEETAGWQSAFARERLNPGGIGAEDDNPDEAHRFETLRKGIRTHVAHMLTYAAGSGPWNADDTRFENTPVAWRGTTTTIGALAGRWATQPKYGQFVAERANLLLDFANNQSWPTEPEAPMGRIPKPPMRTDKRSKNFGHDYAANGGRVIEAIVEHIGEGTSASNLDYLTNGPVSANYFIHEDGTIFELVPPEHSAWTNGDMKQPNLANPLIKKWFDNGWNPNVRTITKEHGGFSTKRKGGAWTPAQWASSVWLDAWLCQDYHLPVDRTHIIGHFEINGVDKVNCPGLSDAEWQQLIERIRNYGSQNPDPSPGPPVMPQTVPDPQGSGFWIPKPILERIQEDDWMNTGHIVSEAFIEGDQIVQYSQRRRFELNRDGRVSLGLVGYEAMVARYPERRRA